MSPSRIFRVVSLIGFLALTSASQATLVLGCNAASRTNVDCADIFGGTLTDQGINFYTQTEYHVGYRRGVSTSTDFMGTAMNVTNHSAYADSVADLATAEQGTGVTMMVDFDTEAALTGMVLSGLSQITSSQSPQNGAEVLIETAQVTAYDQHGAMVFEQLVEGQDGYVYVNFGNIVPRISTLLISSGGGLPGLTSTNTNIAYLITALPEPGSIWLIVTGLGMLALRRRFRQP